MRFLRWIGRAYIFELMGFRRAANGPALEAPAVRPAPEDKTTAIAVEVDEPPEIIRNHAVQKVVLEQVLEQAQDEVQLQRDGLVRYDEDLLEKSRTQLLFGDWGSLNQLDNNELKNHPDRARLSLMAAIAKLQMGEMNAAKRLIRQAEDWGCSKKLVQQALVSSVHNTLGRAAALAGQGDKASLQFRKSVGTALPGADTDMAAAARQQFQTRRGVLMVKNDAIKSTNSNY